ncbi:MAG: hypothetical protein ACR2P1_02925 [Pseudomonadales bacterium]
MIEDIRLNMTRTMIFLVFAGFFAAGCADRYESLEAESGEYNLIELAGSGDDVSFSVKFKLTNFSSNADWPPAAYVGFYQGRNTNDSVQFFIAKDRPTDSYVVAGYRVIEFGEEIRRVNLSTLELNHKANVHMSFVRGLFTVALEGVEPAIIETDLDSVKPYISVSSGAAKFAIDT